jgi:type II secretory pathway predicted ATPase ExeA
MAMTRGDVPRHGQNDLVGNRDSASAVPHANSAESPPQSWARDEVPMRGRPLYGAFYGLNEPPFDLTPNPRYLFLAPRQREALSSLRYALVTSKGFSLILGEAGTGKTTLVRTALSELGDTPSQYVLVNNPMLTRQEFYEFLGQEFGLPSYNAISKTRFLTDLQRNVEARFAAGGLTGLVIDEAQSLPYELLEEIRLLGNIETATTKLLNIVLCGQPELADRLNDPSLRQLKQRLALRCELKPLSLDETAAYISGRLRIAGGSPGSIFTRETVIALHESSRGIPRTINVLCDNALISGFAAQVKPIPVDVVEDVCRDFDISATRSPSGVSGLPEPVSHDAAADGVERPPITYGQNDRKRRFRFFQ